jgi:hypothetical protein
MVTPRKADIVRTQSTALIDIDAFFDQQAATPATGSKTFSQFRGGPEFGQPRESYDFTQTTQRDSGTPALHISSFENAEEWAPEFLAGCEALGFIPTHQQWKIADALNAHQVPSGKPINTTMAVCVPRRAGKTTVLLALALGRCLARPRYSVLFTAQSGTKASARFLQMARDLERINPNEAERGFRIMRGAGNQNVSFLNGSLFQVLPPKPESFRGDAYDLLILDEAQEHTVEVSAELMGSILPTMDTRPGAQLIVAGTAGERRSGLFWETLEEGRKAIKGTGIVEFAAPDTTTPEDAGKPATWTAAHPGIGTMTDLETIQVRFEKLPMPQFMREYLGIWPEDYSTSAIDPHLWRAGMSALIEKPALFAFGYDVAPDGSSASIAAAWRIDDVAYIEIVDHRLGTSWLVPRLVELARRYRVVIGHDTIGAALAEAELLNRQRPRPRTRPAAMKDITTGCATFMKELHNGSIKHFDQVSLNEATARAAKRPLSENQWAWGRRLSGGDITPLVACTLALRTFDNMKPRATMGIVTAKAS